VGLFVLYHANTTVLDEGDAVPTINLPLALLQTGRLSFDPDVHPELFKWKSKAPFVELDDFFLVDWRQPFGGKPASEWRKSGHLTLNGPRYYVLEAPHRGAYVSTFGPIPALVALPFIAPFYAIDHDLAYKLALKTSVGKVGASIIVAGIAVLLFFITLRKTTVERALLLGVLYGTATCAWAVSSQNFWQQTVNQGLLVLGAFFLLGSEDVRRRVALAGLFFGAAAACRQTGVIAVALIAGYLFLFHRKSTLPFALAALVAPALVALHQLYYFGTPFAAAQEVVGHMIAKEKTGSPDLWQTPLARGAAGLLVSPSRGLLVFSPVLALAVLGLYRIIGNRTFGALQPLALFTLATMAVQSKWFDWWGGWAYGYRPWLDVVPFLVLFIEPVLGEAIATFARRLAFGAAFGWSVFVQGLGAMTYDHSWNLREVFVVRRPDRAAPEAFLREPEARLYAEKHSGEYLGPSLCNIDLPFCRHRLWWFADSMILYHFEEYSLTRSRRLPPSWHQLGVPITVPGPPRP